MLAHGIPPDFRGGVHLFIPSYAGSVPSLSGHAIAYRWRSRAAPGGGGVLPDYEFFFFLCSADHERDWPSYKVVFSGLATNTLNVKNNNCRESAGTGPVVKVVRVTGAFAGHHGPISGRVES